jgi:hypothetical protein
VPNPGVYGMPTAPQQIGVRNRMPRADETEEEAALAQAKMQAQAQMPKIENLGQPQAPMPTAEGFTPAAPPRPMGWGDVYRPIYDRNMMAVSMVDPLTNMPGSGVDLDRALGRMYQAREMGLNERNAAAERVSKEGIAGQGRLSNEELARLDRQQKESQFSRSQQFAKQEGDANRKNEIDKAEANERRELARMGANVKATLMGQAAMKARELFPQGGPEFDAYMAKAEIDASRQVASSLGAIQRGVRVNMPPSPERILNMPPDAPPGAQPPNAQPTQTTGDQPPEKPEEDGQDPITKLEKDFQKTHGETPDTQSLRVQEIIKRGVKDSNLDVDALLDAMGGASFSGGAGGLTNRELAGIASLVAQQQKGGLSKATERLGRNMYDRMRAAGLNEFQGFRAGDIQDQMDLPGSTFLGNAADLLLTPLRGGNAKRGSLGNQALGYTGNFDYNWSMNPETAGYLTTQPVLDRYRSQLPIQSAMLQRLIKMAQAGQAPQTPGG